MALVQIAAKEASCSGSNFPNAALRVEVWRDNTGSGVDVPANKETVQVRVMLVRRGTGGTSSWSASGCAASAEATLNVSPTPVSLFSASGLGYDFRSSSGMGGVGATQMLWQGDVVAFHDPDGSKPLYVGASWTGDSNLGSTSVSLTVNLPKITAVPNVPTAVTAVRVSDTQVTLSWSQANPGHGLPSSNEYQVRVNGGAWSSATSVSPTTSVTVAASANQKLEYQVRGVNAAGASAWSDASAPIYTTPAAPTNVSAVKDADLDIDVSWTPNVAFAEHEHVVEESTDGGTTWGALAVVASGTSTYHHDSPDPGVTHRYRVRARNTSGGLTSSWVMSSVVQLLSAPNKPTLPVLPGFVAADLDWVLSWTHNPVDTTAQTAFEVQFSTDGGATWPDTTGKTTSTVSTYTVPADTYDPADAVTVRVRTWGQATTGGSDSAGGSPWSDPQTVTFKSAPVATVIVPADEDTYGQADLVVQVGFAQAEGASFVQATAVLNDGVSDVETVLSGSQTAVFSTPVADGGTYTVTVTVLDSNGVRSAPAVSDFTVSYTLPVPAVLVVTYLRAQGVAQLDVTVPEPGVGEAAAVAVTITRTIGGVSETIVSAYPIVDTLTLLDTTPTVRGENLYRVRTISEDGAVNDVTFLLVTEETDWAFLSTGPGFSRAVAFRSNLQVTAEAARSSALVQAAGRKKPIALFGDQESLVITGSASVFAGAGSTPEEIENFIREADLVCYRDPFGRRVFGQVSGSWSSGWSEAAELSYRIVEAS